MAQGNSSDLNAPSAKKGFLSAAWKMVHARREPAWALASQIVQSGGNFLTTIIFIRAAGLAEFGVFSLAFLFLMICRTFIVALLLTPMAALLPRLRGRALDAYRHFLIGQLALALFVAIIASVAFSAFAELLMNTGGLESAGLPLAFASAGMVLSEFFRRFHFVLRSASRGFLVDLVRFAVQVGSILVLAYAGDGLLDLNSGLLALGASALVSGLLGIHGYGRCRKGGAIRRVFAARHWQFCKTMLVNVSLRSATANIPALVAAALLSASGFGIVRALQQLTQVLALPTLAATQIVASASARSIRSGSLEGILKQTASLTLLLLAGMAGVIAIIWLFPELLEYALDSDVTDATLIALSLFALFNVIQFPRVVLGEMLAGIQWLRQSLLAALIAFVVTAAVTALLSSTFTIASVPIILLSAQLAVMVYLLALVPKLRSLRRNANR